MFFGATEFHSQEVKDACSNYYKLQASVSELEMSRSLAASSFAYKVAARYTRLKENAEFELIKHRFIFPELFCHWEGLRKRELVSVGAVDDPASLGVCCL